MATGRKTGGRVKGSRNKPKVSTPAATYVEAGARLSLPDSRVPVRVREGGPEQIGLELRVDRRVREGNPLFPKYRIARVDSLSPYANNPRTHTPAQVDLVAKLITEFGWTNPILVDGKRGVIAGHGRLLAAQKLGIEFVPTIELSHLSAAQRRAYVLADNKSAELAGWDNDLLALELGELREDGFDLSLTGFDGRELDVLFGEPPDLPGPEPETSVEKTVCPECGRAFTGGVATLESTGASFAAVEAARSAPPAKAARTSSEGRAIRTRSPRAKAAA